MDDNFKENERLYRAVYPYEMYWKKDGSISSAAFLDRKREGLSVERGNGREDAVVVDDMRNMGFIGSAVAVTVNDCHNIEAYIYYRPSKRSIYHSEIHGSAESPVLSPRQRKALARAAIVIKHNLQN